MEPMRPTFSVSPDSPAARCAAAVNAQREQIFTDLSELVAFRSVHAEVLAMTQEGHAAHPEHKENVESYDAAAAWVEDKLTELGFDAKTIHCADKSQAVFAEKPGAPGAPTVLLYSHFDVVSPGDETEWDHPPFQLTEVDGRWAARGAADCKGAVVMHLAALRALRTLEAQDGALDRTSESEHACGIKVIVEGSEENGGAGLRELVREQPDLLEADAIFIADTGNAEVGQPSLVTMLRGSAQVRVRVETLHSPAHSGKFGGAAPDAVAALIRALDSLRDEEGRTTIDGLDCRAQWTGQPYPEERFRADAGVLGGVETLGGDEDSVADLVWARPAVTVTGFSSAPVEQAVNAVPAHAEAQLNLRVPPELGLNTREAAEVLVRHIENHVPWGARVTADILSASQFFTADVHGDALTLLEETLTNSYGRETALVGTGGSIPLTVELSQAYPGADIALFGVQDAAADIHSPTESVDPSEIVHIAAAEAEFLARFGR